MDTHWVGPVGESDVGAAVGPELAVVDGAVPGVVGERMTGSGGLGVVPQLGGTEIEIWEAGVVRSGTRANTVSRA